MSTVSLNVQFTNTLKRTQYNTNRSLASKLLNKEEQVAVVGLGYVGLPLALSMSEKFSVVGFDINESKVFSLNQGHDPCDEVKDEEFEGKDISFYANGQALEGAKFFIVAVPTPVDENRIPNLNALRGATRMVANHISKGAIIVFESTVYPGCTEEVCVPILEEVSGLTYNKDFFVGYSPERINPGDTKNTFKTITKIVSGSTANALEEIAKVYDAVVTAGIHKAPSIKVAEAAKVVENTQRDVNIALMNELSYIFDKVGISIHDVLAAAGTKWNFLNFFPGMVGGHCIGVDPYYLIHKAKELGAETNLIESSRKVNENMSMFLAEKMVKAFVPMNKFNTEINILVKGITFKENVKDVRNSKIADLITLLKKIGYNVVIEDPYAEAEDVRHEYGLELAFEPQLQQQFDAVVFAVNHDDYHDLNENQVDAMLTKEGFILDIRGVFQYLAGSHKYMTI